MQKPFDSTHLSAVQNEAGGFLGHLWPVSLAFLWKTERTLSQRERESRAWPHADHDCTPSAHMCYTQLLFFKTKQLGACRDFSVVRGTVALVQGPGSVSSKHAQDGCQPSVALPLEILNTHSRTSKRQDWNIWVYLSACIKHTYAVELWLILCQ